MKFLLHRWIYIGFVFNFILLLILGWVVIQRQQNAKEMAVLEDTHKKVTAFTSQALAILNDIENKSKGFVLTADERYLNEFERLELSLGKTIENLNHLYKNDETQLTNIIALEKLIDKKLLYNQQLIELRKYRDFKHSQNNIAIEWEIQITNQVQRIINQMQAVENKNYQSAITPQIELEQYLKIVFIGLLISSLLLTIVVLFIIKYHLRKRQIAEMQLNEKNQLLQSIMDNTNNPIYVKQISGQYIFVNKSFEALSHFTSEQLKGKTDYDIFSKEIAEAVRSTDIDVIKNGKEMKIEEKLPHNETLRTYIIVKFPLKDNEGKIYAIGSIATDITEKSQIETLIKEKEDEISTLFRSAPDAIIVIDQDDKITKWNSKAEEMFGWKAAEVIGKQLTEIIIPLHYREAHLKGIQHFLKTGEGPALNKTVELTALNKSNKEFPIELIISAIAIKEKYLFVSFIRDITQRKLLEDEFHQSKKFMDSIIDHIPDMIVVKDAMDLRFVLLNKFGENLLGYTSTELLGKNDYDFFPREQADFITSKDREVLKKGELVEISEELIDTKTGKRWLHTKKIPIKDDVGKPVYLLAISEDITEKKYLEDQRDEAEKSLKENEERMKLILDNIGEGVIVIDLNHKILLSNQMAEEILGISEEINIPVFWTDHFDITYSDSRKKFSERNLPLERALKGEITNEIEMLINKFKTPEEKLRIVVSARPIRNDKQQIIAAVATIRDVTKYKELERALEESETKFRRLIGFRRSQNGESGKQN